MTKHFVVTILTSLIFLSCDKGDKENIIGTWTTVAKLKNGKELRKEGDDKTQLEFFATGEMKHLISGGRAGIGVYSYKIIKDSIYRTNIQIDSLGKRDSISLGSNKFFIRHDTLIIEADEGTLYYKKDSK